MIDSPSNLTEQLLNLVERIAIEMRAIYKTADLKLSKEYANETYVKKEDKILNASNADIATQAVQDGEGNSIVDTYLTKSSASSIYLKKSDKAISANTADSIEWDNINNKPSVFTPSSHTQASDTITSLSGYSKASLAAPIYASDSLNIALGKIEKSLDNKLSTAGIAAKATADANGNTITTTYATKLELNNKVDPSTTLTGYGITDAYTKVEVDTKISNIPTYSLPVASTTLGGVKTTSTVNSISGLTPCPIISGVPYYKDTVNSYTLGSFGVNATSTELNYVKGVTSSIQSQLDDKLNKSSKAVLASSADSATNDSEGNKISSTYAKLSGAVFTGEVKATAFQATSDRRLKTIIKEVKDIDLSNIKTYTYFFTDDPKERIRYGVMAQDVKEVLPNAVFENNDKYYSVDYNGIVAVLINKINKLEQELITIKTSLKC